MLAWCHRRALSGLLFFALVSGTAAGPQGPPPEKPLEEIVAHFAKKEEEYARAHALYRYHLRIKVEELAADDTRLGVFEQEMDVGFDRSGRRQAELTKNPQVDLSQLPISRVRLEDLNFIPLFVLSREEIPNYEITYLSREKLDEVETFVFRIEPNRPARPNERLFEGLVWVDADKLDIVRAHGRVLPERTGSPFGEYFRRVEAFREPVDDYLFPTYVRSRDVLAARGERIDAQLIVRFTDHERVAAGTE